MNKAVKSSDEVRIAVVDDHPIVQQALASLIAHTKGWTLCGQAASASKARAMVESTQPQLVVVDISLEDSHGLDLIKDLQALFPEIKILVFSHHDELQYAERTIRAGASGYVMKSEPPDTLVKAIQAILSGEIYLSPRMNHMVVNHAFDRRKPRPASQTPAESRLTDREVTVLELLGNGMGTRQIAETLNLSIKTIDAHRANLKRKLGLHDAVELVCYASRWVQDTQSRSFREKAATPNGHLPAASPGVNA
jgi:DNA-binding NarL/FixJ family response regulator